MSKRPGTPEDRAPSEERLSASRVFIPLTLDRRSFVLASGATVVSAATGLAIGQDTSSAQEDPPLPGTQLEDRHFSDVMDRPAEAPSAEVLRALTIHEAETVDALTSRILPGTPDDPGAHEAGVVTYIDTLLAYNNGYAEFTYLQPPFAQTRASAELASSGTPVASPSASPGATPVASPGATPATGTSDPGYDVIWVDEHEIERYGYQSVLSPRDVYRIGVGALDGYTTQNYDKLFKELDASQQDEVVGKMADGSIESFDSRLTAQSFFQNLRRHTAEGMFSDPAYGGNRDLVGWKLIGFPGAQRAYVPAEFQTEGTNRQPQSMDQLHPFDPGHAPEGHDDVILPVSGSEEEHDDDSQP